MTAAGTQCFYLHPTDRHRVSLRRRSTSGACPSAADPHDHCAAEAVVGVEVHADTPSSGDDPARHPHGDPRWPAACRRCGRAFADADEWYVRYEHLYERGDGGGDCTIREAPPGAMWDASWMPEVMRGPDGRCLTVRLPNGRDWCVDGEASNCTRPGDRSHHCWVRHGEPPAITVDKDGPTCDAGGGSIQSGDYHGFLRSGVLTP